MGNGEPDSLHDLRDVLSHPYVVEVLDVLWQRAMTLAEISSGVPAGRRGLAVALQVAAAHGLVTRTDSGRSAGSSINPVYHHTDLGRLTVDTLSSLSVWTAMFEDGDHSWKR
jgi:hypothetical protein